jgi:hypothetical protein
VRRLLPCSGGRKEKPAAILPYNYIRDCSAAVCVIGKRSGALQPPAAAKPFKHNAAAGHRVGILYAVGVFLRAISSGACRLPPVSFGESHA